MSRSVEEPVCTKVSDAVRETEQFYDYELAILAFTEQISALMERQGFSKVELAQRMGKRPSYITRILKGKGLTFKEAIEIAHALGWNFLPLLVENTRQVIEASAVAVSRGVLELPLVEAVAKRLKPAPGTTPIQ